jgi:hypothetical protein
MISVGLNLRRLDLGRFFLRAGATILFLNRRQVFITSPVRPANPHNIVNRNPRQAVGYLASLGPILIGQRFAILAASTNGAVVVDLNFKQ